MSTTDTIVVANAINAICPAELPGFMARETRRRYESNPSTASLWVLATQIRWPGAAADAALNELDKLRSEGQS